MDIIKSSKLDCTGQPIYIGLDVHKKSWSVSVYSRYGEFKTFTQPPQADKLVHYLKRHFPGGDYHSVYEAGYCGFWIHDQLKERGINCTIVNPADVPTKQKEEHQNQLSEISKVLLGNDLNSVEESSSIGLYGLRQNGMFRYQYVIKDHNNRTVQLSPFWIGKVEVRWKEWDIFYSQRGSQGKDYLLCPLCIRT